MKVKVIKDYRDKYTRGLHKVNEELTITKERFEEINSTALGVFVEEIKEELPKEPQNDSSLENKEIDFENMTKKELVEYAASKKIELDMDMTKKEMIDILLKR